MKKSLLFLCFLSISFPGISQTLFTYGQKAVSKQEFEIAFNKNKTTKAADNKEALRDYLDLYIAFKLKVQAAKDLRMDTLSSFKTELENYKNQIEEFYLKDEKVVKKLINEAFDRSQKEIHLIDYFIAFPEGADTAQYFKALQQLQKLLKNKQGKALTNENNIQEVKTDVGYITAFTLPYIFENIIYNLKPGMVSEPVRTADGWHIFENAGERKAVGQIRVAQILISAPEQFEKERHAAKKLADSVYNLLQKGANFAKLAKEFSHDRTSFFNEGILPAFGVGKYEKTFEEKAFSLKKDGDILPPFETEFGYHILKRISVEPVPTSSDNETFLEELAQKVAKDDRMKEAKKVFDTKMVKLTGAKQTNIDMNALWLYTDSSLLANKMITSGKVNEETALIEFNDQSVAAIGDWTLYLRNTAASLMGNISAQYPALMTEFVRYSSLINYKKRLAHFNSEFKAQIDEFRDGNLLFEVMGKEVWNKAVTDSAGLQDFYKKNAQKYTRAESADVIIFSCVNETIAKRVMEDLKKGKSKELIMEENESLIQIDSGRYELQQISILNGETLSVHNITQPVFNENDGTVIFTRILKLYPANDPRSFEEARGMVISDYQYVLEEEWLNKLKSQYPVKINRKTFNKLIN